MGSSSSKIESGIEENKSILKDAANEEPGPIAEYIFKESDDIKSLPNIDEPIKIRGPPPLIDQNTRKKITEEKNNQALEKVEPIDKQVIKYLTEKDDIVVDEFDIYSLVSIISAFTPSHNLLILTEDKMIGNIFECFAETSTKIGYKTNDTDIDFEQSKIIDFSLFKQIDYQLYNMIILVMNCMIPLDYVNDIIEMLSQQNMPIIVYRLPSSHNYGDQIFNEKLQNIKYLKAPERNNARKIHFLSNIDFENYENETFSTIDEAYETFKRSSLQQGFEIYSKDSTKPFERRARFYCKGSNDKQNDAKSCPFTIYLKYDKSTHRYYIKYCKAEHNHEMDKAGKQWKLLSSKQIRLILSLRRNRMPIIEINKMLLDLYGIDIQLTNRKIRKLKRDGMIRNNTLETIELENYIKSHGGYVKTKNDPDGNGKVIRSAILCIEKDELENLLSSNGDPVFIDGTAVPNRLNWELTLITLIDQNLNIQPGGMMFSLNTNKETYDWFLENFLEVIKDRNEITMISDEDLAITSLLKQPNQYTIKINHVICAWHKTINFEKKLNKCNLEIEVSNTIKMLWKRICYSAKKDVVLQSIEDIKSQNIIKLSHYLDKHVIPLLKNFSRAFIDEFTAGYNVSSIAESANSMIKRNLCSAYYTLLEIKDVIRRSYLQKNLTLHEKMNAVRRGGSFLEEKFGIMVGPKVEERLIASLLKSFRLVQDDENSYRDPIYPDEEFTIEYPVCECGNLKYCGLPCSHLIRYCLDHKMNPMLLVSKRFLKCEPSVIELSDYISISGNALKELAATQYKNNRIKMKEKQPSLINHFIQSIPRENILPNLPEPNKTQTVRYNDILSYAKDLAKHASKSEEQTNLAIEKLKKMIDDATIINEEANIDQNSIIYEPKSRRKGRPKHSRFRSSFENSTKRKCNVCEKLGLDSNHLTGLCKNYKRLIEIGKKNAENSSGNNKCSLCKCPGHTCRKCISLKELIQEIESSKTSQPES